MDNNELMHYGRKGMKWYQNIFTKKKSSGKKSDQDDDDTQEQKPKPKTRTAKDMSNEELRRAIERKRLEDDYNRMYPQQVSKGQKFMNSIAKDILAPAAKEIGKDFTKQLMAKGLTKATGVQVSGNKPKKVQKKDD